MPSPSSTPSDPTSLKCAACGCHRNFHRREPDDFSSVPPPSLLPSSSTTAAIEYQPHHRHHPPPLLAPPLPRSPSSSSLTVAEGDRKRTREFVVGQGDGPQGPALLEEPVWDPTRETIAAEIADLEAAETEKATADVTGEREGVKSELRDPVGGRVACATDPVAGIVVFRSAVDETQNVVVESRVCRH
ncbi:unnamed protein product [Arabidopsis lyrata]|nr:unnamed protein product [Arabidopsis lyrata]